MSWILLLVPVVGSILVVLGVLFVRRKYPLKRAEPNVTSLDDEYLNEVRRSASIADPLGLHIAEGFYPAQETILGFGKVTSRIMRDKYGQFVQGSVIPAAEPFSTHGATRRTTEGER